MHALEEESLSSNIMINLINTLPKLKNLVLEEIFLNNRTNNSDFNIKIKLKS